MAADELHGWVALRGLLPEDGAGEHRVVPALLPQVDFNLQLQMRCQSSQGFGEGPTAKSRQDASGELTGSSSLCVQTPLHCLCSITCLMFISTGNAMQPDAKLKANETMAKLHLGEFLVNELAVNLG